jgi:hypothetical protein
MRRANHVIRTEIDAASDRNSLLATAHIHAAQDLALSIKLSLDAVFEFPRELQVIKDANLGLGRGNVRALVGEWGRIHRLYIHRIVLSRCEFERYPKPRNLFKARDLRLLLPIAGCPLTAVR